ncbi:MAG: V-type ATP synthase subunit D [Gaiellales bacterium]|nr:V-type ATP synthase subunit D [Gaiellales bacterium]
MAKIKKTKNALKAERESLARFYRFLPTLELKKQQLQSEVRRADGEYREKMAEEAELREQLKTWVKLFSSDIDVGSYLRLVEVRTSTGNIAGVNVPIMEETVFQRAPVDLFQTPAWVDDALEVLQQLVRLRVEQSILAQQRDLLGEELRITSQRVNLFEKVKIPETQEHIRVIQIALGDAQTAGVVRAKIAKGKTAAIVSGTGAT